MYLFRSLFTTEKLHYFKVQFDRYLKVILSKENGNDLKYDLVKQIGFSNYWQFKIFFKH